MVDIRKPANKVCDFYIFLIHMIYFCTLFDSGYLDKGIVLYKSLERSTDDFRLFIFCFDSLSADILEKKHFGNEVIIRWEQYETPELLEKKKERTKAEYCWTCTPQIIQHVLDHYQVDHCIYIDADMFFFSDPHVLLDEIKGNHANIAIMEHRFADDIWGRRLLRRSGRFCVEFNYFDQSENARNALQWWADKCMEWCYHLYEPERMGDQKYLEKFPSLFDGVHIMKNLGAGIAPWNLGQYQLYRTENGDIYYTQPESGDHFKVILVHFQNIRFISKNKVNVYSGTHRKNVKDAIYIPYLKEIVREREELKEDGVIFNDHKVASSNPLMALWQRCFMQFKIRSLSDIYDLDNLSSVR